jgi:hypothetical protein
MPHRKPGHFVTTGVPRRLEVSRELGNGPCVRAGHGAGPAAGDLRWAVARRHHERLRVWRDGARVVWDGGALEKGDSVSADRASSCGRRRPLLAVAGLCAEQSPPREQPGSRGRPSLSTGRSSAPRPAKRGEVGGRRPPGEGSGGAITRAALPYRLSTPPLRGARANRLNVSHGAQPYAACRRSSIAGWARTRKVTPPSS